MYKNYVEEIISGNLNEKIPNAETPDEMRYYSSAIQLIKNWELYKKNPIYQMDFEITLRDFLLLIKSNIKIENYSISK